MHVLDDKPGDVDLLKRALEQFHKHNENLKSKDINNSYYLIGPTVMRALAFLEQPDIAVTVKNILVSLGLSIICFSFLFIHLAIRRQNHRTDFRSIRFIFGAFEFTL